MFTNDNYFNEDIILGLNTCVKCYDPDILSFKYE
jgi:hypothetical protein